MKNLKIILIIIFTLIIFYIIYHFPIINNQISNTNKVDLFETTDVAVIIRFYKKYGIDISEGCTTASAMYKINGPASNDFQFYPNDGKNIPRENDMIIWWTKGSTDGSPGHVGIIAEVEFDKKNNIGTVWTVEQGRGDKNLFSYELTRHSDGSYHVTGFDDLEVKGWNHPLRSDLQVEPTNTTISKSNDELLISKALGIQDTSTKLNYHLVSNYARVGVSDGLTGYYAILVKEKGEWIPIYTGQDKPSCSLVKKYNVPDSIYKKCF